MITDSILEIIFDVIGGVLFGIMDLAPPIPSAVAGAFGTAQSVWAWLDSFDTWIPVDVAMVCVGVVLAAYAYSLIVGLARVIVSYFTLGGGAT